MPDASTRLHEIDTRIDQACALSGRKREHVTLVAVSKTRTASEIEELIEAGQRDFGESRVQEALEKWPPILARNPGVRLHHIGKLQSNKAADAAKLYDVIHSLDRNSLLGALAAISSDGGSARPSLFVQVNIGEEQQKGGCAIKEVPAFVAKVREAGLPLLGLMGIAPLGVQAAPYFALLAKLAQREGLQGLSMGMSGDFEDAIKLGATDIRVGTALFEKQ